MQSKLNLLAGDIEKNLGPRQAPDPQPKCRKCTGKINNGRDFLTCKGCKKAFHKQKKCSGEKKANQINTEQRANWMGFC